MTESESWFLIAGERAVKRKSVNKKNTITSQSVRKIMYFNRFNRLLHKQFKYSDKTGKTGKTGDLDHRSKL